MVSIKNLIAAIALPLAAAYPYVSTRAASAAPFDAIKPFTLHTEVVKGDASFGGFYLTPFHVGAGLQTVVGTKNSSTAIGWVINSTYLEQPISSSSGNIPPYKLSLVSQKPYRSNAPAGYDYISLGVTGSTPGFSFHNTTEFTIQYSGNSTVPAFGGFALCHVNGTSPYFTLGPQYQLLWRTANTTCDYKLCADVNLVAANI